jgi:hypothetical protein
VAILFSYWSNTYENIQEKSDIVWKNQRYSLIVEYYQLVPAPLNLLVYFFYFGKFIQKKICNKQKIVENFNNECNFWLSLINLILILFYLVDILIDFERKCAQEHLKNIESIKQNNK